MALGGAIVGRAGKGKGKGRKSSGSDSGASGKSKSATQGTGCPAGKENCFVKGTLVVMADEARTPVDTIETGTWVWVDPSLSDNASSILQSQKIVRIDLVPLESDDHQFAI